MAAKARLRTAFQVNNTPPEEKRARARLELEKPVFLVLKAFNSIPKLDFESVKLGSVLERRLTLQNPDKNKAVRVVFNGIEKCNEAGFEIEFVDFVLGPKEQVDIRIGWVPQNFGQKVREKLTVKYGEKAQTHAILLGNCPEDPTLKKRTPLLSANNSLLGKKSVNKGKKPILPENPVKRNLDGCPEIVQMEEKSAKKDEKAVFCPPIPKIVVNEDQSFYSSTPSSKNDANKRHFHSDISVISDIKSKKELFQIPVIQTPIVQPQNVGDVETPTLQTMTIRPEKPTLSPREIVGDVNVSEIVNEFMNLDETENESTQNLSQMVQEKMEDAKNASLLIQNTINEEENVSLLVENAMSEDKNGSKNSSQGTFVVAPSPKMQDLEENDQDLSDFIKERLEKHENRQNLSDIVQQRHENEDHEHPENGGSTSKDTFVVGQSPKPQNLDLDLAEKVENCEEKAEKLDLSELVQQKLQVSEKNETNSVEKSEHENSKNGGETSKDTFVIAHSPKILDLNDKEEHVEKKEFTELSKIDRRAKISEKLQNYRKNERIYQANLEILKEEAAIVIQKWVRGFLAKRRFARICAKVERLLVAKKALEDSITEKIKDGSLEISPKPPKNFSTFVEISPNLPKNGEKSGCSTKNSPEISPNSTKNEDILKTKQGFCGFVEISPPKNRENPEFSAVTNSPTSFKGVLEFTPSKVQKPWNFPRRQKTEIPKRRTLNLTKTVEKKPISAKKQSQEVTFNKPLAPKPTLSSKKLVLAKKKKPKSSTEFDTAPNPFSGNNMYYDEKWVFKQEFGFSKWLNFVLTPIEKIFDLNSVRKNACTLFQTPANRAVIRRLEIEVENRALSIREDRNLNRDVGLKNKFLQLLLSYNPVWLRVALETVFGQVLSLQFGDDMTASLSHFLTNRVLFNPSIAAKFAHKTVPHLYTPGYEEELKKFTLKMFLKLVYFLDLAKSFKESDFFSNFPCLFLKDSKWKSSAAILNQFNSDFLAGEGNLVKHLAYFGFKVQHEQVPLDEFDYRIKNLGIDLRDGVRLCRLMELLSGESLRPNLRMPALTRLQKTHNIDLALNVIKKKCQNLEINARNIADGHLEKTLALIWKIIMNWQVEKILNMQDLRREIVKIGGNFANLEEFECEKAGLLFEWSRAIGAKFGVEVQNFTTSFGDGTLLCIILHNYLPTYLKKDQICYEKGNEKLNFKLLQDKVRDLGGIPLLLRSSDMVNTLTDERVISSFLAFLASRLIKINQDRENAAKTLQVAFRKRRHQQRN